MELRITLGAECSPPFAAELNRSNGFAQGEPEDISLHFQVTQAELRDLTAEWKAQVSRFPVRGAG